MVVSFDHELCIYDGHNGNCVASCFLFRSPVARCQLFAMYRGVLLIFSFPSRSSPAPVRASLFKGASTAAQSDEMLFHQRRNYKMVKQAHRITRPSPFHVASCTWVRNKGTDQWNFASTRPYFLLLLSSLSLSSSRLFPILPFLKFLINFSTSYASRDFNSESSTFDD